MATKHSRTCTVAHFVLRFLMLCYVRVCMYIRIYVYTFKIEVFHIVIMIEHLTYIYVYIWLLHAYEVAR